MRHKPHLPKSRWVWYSLKSIKWLDGERLKKFHAVLPIRSSYLPGHWANKRIRRTSYTAHK